MATSKNDFAAGTTPEQCENTLHSSAMKKGTDPVSERIGNGVPTIRARLNAESVRAGEGVSPYAAWRIEERPAGQDVNRSIQPVDDDSIVGCGANSINNRPLLELYRIHENTILDVRSRCPEDMNGPFLIAPNDACWSTPTRVAFIGQETQGWRSEPEIPAQMERYRRFNLGERYFSSPFWNVIRKFETALSGGTLNSAWLNLNRFDQGWKRPSRENRGTLSELDFLLLEELKLVSPAISIWFTGPTCGYDKRIMKLLQGTLSPVAKFSSRELSRIDTPVLRGTHFRTYHPNYLRRSGLEKSVIDAIVAEAGK